MNNLILRGSHLQGGFAGRNLDYSVHAGPSPAPGAYGLCVVDSPLFGKLAVLAPASQSAGSTPAGSWDWGNRASWDWGNRASWEWGNRASWDWGNRASWDWGNRASWDWGNRASWDWGNRGGGAQASCKWCICDRIVPGRKCLTLVNGFVDLIAALQAAGPVPLMVY